MRNLPPLAADSVPVAHEIHRRARELGFSQKRLAVEAGVNETYIRDLFRGKSKNPKGEQLERVAKILKCTIDDLLRPRPTGRTKARSETIYDVDELALLGLWRELSPVGRQMVLYRIHQLLPAPEREEVNDV